MNCCYLATDCCCMVRDYWSLERGYCCSPWTNPGCCELKNHRPLVKLSCNWHGTLVHWSHLVGKSQSWKAKEDSLEAHQGGHHLLDLRIQDFNQARTQSRQQ